MPWSARQLPNVITSIRILLVVPLAAALAAHRLNAAIVLFGAAALSDAADGFIARRYGWCSELGAVLDPLADKILLVTVFVTLAFLKLVPLWLMATAAGRDLIIVLGALSYRYWCGPLRMSPSAVSKLNTLYQAAYLWSVLVREQFSQPAAWVVTALGALVFVTMAISGMDYVINYGRRALQFTASRAAASRAAASPAAASRATASRNAAHPGDRRA